MLYDFGLHTFVLDPTVFELLNENSFCNLKTPLRSSTPGWDPKDENLDFSYMVQP